ncbi:MAG TPA: hypothetical protein VM187_13825, partial [Niastella sp.]|nr:hypothetical protein [Niastella sp.]
FGDEHIQAPANDYAFIFPHFFHQLIRIYHFVLGVGKYVQQFGFFGFILNQHYKTIISTRRFVVNDVFADVIF